MTLEQNIDEFDGKSTRNMKEKQWNLFTRVDIFFSMMLKLHLNKKMSPQQALLFLAFTTKTKNICSNLFLAVLLNQNQLPSRHLY